MESKDNIFFESIIYLNRNEKLDSAKTDKSFLLSCVIEDDMFKIKANDGLLGPNCPWWLGFTGFSPHPQDSTLSPPPHPMLKKPTAKRKGSESCTFRENGPLQIMDLADISCLLHWIFVFWVLVNSFSCGHLHSLRCRRGRGTLTSVKCSQHSTVENEAASWVLSSCSEVGPEVVKWGRKSVAWTCGHVRIWCTR